MGFFSKKGNESVALISIDSSSVGGALVHLPSAAAPVIYYSARNIIEPKPHESPEEAMFRTLHSVAQELVVKGAPILRKETGSGHSDRIVVSIGSPWQKTNIVTETLSEKTPFVFSPALLRQVVRRSGEIEKGYVESAKKVIATILNGYDVPEPVGKKISRADIIMLSSQLQKSVVMEVEKTLRKTYHTHQVQVTAFAPVSYEVFRKLYPHERDFLVLQVSEESTDLVFIKRGVLANVGSEPYGIGTLLRDVQTATELTPADDPLKIVNSERNEKYGVQVDEARTAWIAQLRGWLETFANKNALPRTLFLLSDQSCREYLKRLLDDQSLRTLWLTDDPLHIVTVQPSQFSKFVVSKTPEELDVFMAMLALFSTIPKG